MLSSTQVVGTVPSSFLQLRDAVYEASPLYTVKAASPDERLVWSADGRRLAAVSTLGNETPGAAERRLTQGVMPQSPLKVGIWSRESGQYREVFVPQNPMTSIDDFVFVGRDLLVSAGSKLWFIPDGGTAKALAFPDDTFFRLIPSPSQSAVLIVSQHRVWLMNTQQTSEVQVPKPGPYYGRGIGSDGRARLAAGSDWFHFDFRTRTFSSADGGLQPLTGFYPFILDAYRLSGGSKSSLLDEDPEAAKVDAKTNPVDDEDGGFRLDLVERTGAPRRRLRFIPEMARTVEVSNDGLAFAFISNRTVTVRWLVKLSAAAAKQRLGLKN